MVYILNRLYTFKRNKVRFLEIIQFRVRLNSTSLAFTTYCVVLDAISRLVTDVSQFRVAQLDNFFQKQESY